MRLYAYIFVWLCLSGGIGRAAHVYFNLQNFTTQNVSNKTFKIVPVSPPFSSGSAIILREPQTVTTGNGAFYVSNMVAGTYTCTVSTPITPTTFTLPVPDTNGAVNAYQLVTNGLPSILLTNLFLGNTLWVDRANGNDSSAARNDLVHRFQSISAAKSNAIAGDTIMVLPGLYAGNNYAKSNVAFHGFSGAILTNNVPASTGDNWGFFDDRATGAAGPMKITGSFEMWWRDSNPPNTNVIAGAVVVTNAITELTLDAKKIIASSRVQIAGIWIKNCKKSIVHVNEISDTWELWSMLDDPDFPTMVISSAQGVYWELGESHLSIDRNVMNGGYALWCHQPAQDAAGSLYYEGKLMASSNNVCFYTDVTWTNTIANYKVWLDPVTELFGHVIAVSTIGPSRVYVLGFEKISCDGTAIDLEGTEAWIAGQKVTSPTKWIAYADAGFSGGTIFRDSYIDVQQFDATGALNNGIDNSSRGNLYLRSQRLVGAASSLTLVRHAGGGQTVLQGAVSVDASAGVSASAWPITVSSNGLVLGAGVSIVGSAASETIHTNNAGALLIESRGWNWSNKEISPTLSVSNGVLQTPLAMLGNPPLWKLWSQTGDGTDTNVANNVEVTMLGSGSGSLTIQPNIWVVGRQFKLEVQGNYWTTGSALNEQFNFKLGSTTLLSKVISPATSVSGDPWFADFQITCRTNGTLGAVQASGKLQFGATVNRFTNSLTILNLNGPLAADLTSTNGAANSTSFLSHEGALTSR